VSDQIFHIVVAGDTLQVIRRPGGSSQTFQTEFPDFKTSLGPFNAMEVIEMLEVEWPDTLLINRFNVVEFLDGSAGSIMLE
jgi:hypothetical protein